jgi:energy-coupling factor transport system substrate-specific component
VGLATFAVAAALAATPAQYLQSHALADGSFAESGGRPGPQLTAWAALGLRASGAAVQPQTLDYLVAHEAELKVATDLELVALAELALGGRAEALLARIRALSRPSGGIGPTLNSTIWGVLALRAAGDPAPRAVIRRLLAAQGRAGGWSWAAGVEADSNDTAAAIQALRASGVSGAPIRRGLAYLRGLQNADGGFELSSGRGSDAQSTAWAIQAFVAAGEQAPPAALRYLARVRRPDGSYRYSARYVATPVWVTAQVLPALALKPFPLRATRAPAGSAGPTPRGRPRGRPARATAS